MTNAALPAFADAESFRDSGLPFHHSHGERRLIRRGVARTLEQQGRILLVVAVHDNGIKVLRHQFLNCRERLGARLDSKFQIVQNVRYSARRFLVRAEE